MDLIERQAAIDAIAKFVPYAICDESTESYVNGLTDAYNLICQLPSARPDRKKGKWLWVDGVRCSRCNFKLQTTGLPTSCPNCVADMRGDAE